MSENSVYISDVDAIIAQEMARARQRRAIAVKRVAADEEVVSPNALDTSPSFQVARLPHELLLHIFRETVPPIYQHDPSVIQGPRNPWLTALRTRKALVLTCKTFFGPATEVLYEDIVIRRMGQIPALARTLGPSPSSSSRDVGTLVRRFRMDACVVWAPCAEVVREDLRLILQRCTQLRWFSFHPHPHFPFANEPFDNASRDGFNPSWLLQPDPDCDSVGGLLRERLGTSLRVLDLALELDERVLLRLQWLLAAASGLTVLKLGRVARQQYSDELMSHPTLCLPSLRDLQIYVDHSPFERYVSQRWELPQLRLLTATGCEEVPEELLRAHGSRLTYLHMHHGVSFAWELPRLASLAHLGTLCPLLEHLVIPTWIRDPLTINAPALRFVDVWGHHPPPHIWKQGWYQLDKTSAVPNLQRVRILTTMPLQQWESLISLDWPLICHPAAVRGDAERRVYVFPGVRAVQTSWGVLHDFEDHDVSWSYPDGHGERRDNSGWYEEEDSVADTSSVVTDEDDEDDRPQFTVEEELEMLLGDRDRGPEQLSREVVLDMFHDSQGRVFLFDDD
ncbi:hypothetical protein L226DRAFT_561941 [Lentinus tigrinus ALCF2SS1-7]|uniref:F-box domain-containing protein n=1 Tax=Lentinus tigrinus ALCF2SS1-6 TaxID=1328759 RepID=A0A5C2S373_9APHY|nr:hypothetical protein L227DRAFT_564981 [Lentinus tigrinus ALCF2SS1-6]RPD72264.1 hypothetical protein L226DRAFT_561941 [Lentinus tigrinus ALCF2SS1-7]